MGTGQRPVLISLALYGIVPLRHHVALMGTGKRTRRFQLAELDELSKTSGKCAVDKETRAHCNLGG